MDTTLLKLVVTPALITCATLLGRRFGQAIAGWLIAFPWTSAPVSLFLALDHGTPFAAAAARGSIAAVAAECAFALAFAWIDRGWAAALAAASIAYVATALLMQLATLEPVFLAIAMVAVLAVSARSLPRLPARPLDRADATPAWDLPARVIVATSLVLVITAVAPALGPYGSAVAASFPLFASILAVFGERTAGHAAAVDVMRGLVHGLFGFMTFFLVIATTLEPLGLVAFVPAAAATLVVQAVSFTRLTRKRE